MTTTTAVGTPTRTDPNFQGNNAPVHRELDVIDLPVNGELPADLAGVCMRNGPNPAFDPVSYTYPFDGDGMIHAVYFDSGRARYRNRWVLTPGLRAELRAGRALYGGLMDPTTPDPELVGPDGDPGPLKNVANTSVVRHAGHILALYEAGLPMELDRDLHTVGTFNFGGRLVESMTAHPKSDPINGDLHFFRYALHEPFLTYYCADSTGRIVQQQPIDMPASPFMHDFAITESSIVFVDTPAQFDVDAVRTGSGSMLAWRPELGTRIGVLPRDCSRPPTWVSTEPFFVYHFLNAYDNGPVIHIDL